MYVYVYVCVYVCTYIYVCVCLFLYSFIFFIDSLSLMHLILSIHMQTFIYEFVSVFNVFLAFLLLCLSERDAVGISKEENLTILHRSKLCQILRPSTHSNFNTSIFFNILNG